MTIEARVGKKYAIYLPKAIVKALGLREGERVFLTVSGSTLVVEKLQDPIQLALSGRKFASITPKQVEAVSLEEQEKRVKGSP